MKKLSISLALILGLGWSSSVCAKSITPANQIPAYYQSVDGQSGDNLWKSVNTVCLKGFSTLGYDGLWTAYKTTDVYPQGHSNAGKIWDMYGECNFTYDKDQCGTYHDECDCYNREHSIPKSWFGDSKSGCGCDIFHLIPTDGKVNGMRSNNDFGEVKSATYTYNGNKLGSSVSSIKVEEKTICTAAGGTVSASGTVFEPIDEYKGDFARGYFGTLVHWYSNYSFTLGNKMFSCNKNATKSNNYGLTAYGVALLMKWHREDPVSQKEIDRNNGIQQTQGNRNPFIDYPFLAEYIWGKKAGEAVCLDCMMPSTDASFIPGKSDGWKGQSSGWEVIPTDEDNMTPTEGKIIRNGQLIIIANGVEYNAFGQRIK